MRPLAAVIPPAVIMLAFFAPLGGIGPWSRSALVLASFALAGALAGGDRPARAGLLVALPGVAVGLFLTLAGAMEPVHLAYGVAMAGGGVAISVAAASVRAR